MTYAVKMKCLSCSLHFEIYTWQEDWHEKMHGKVYCPECGTQGGKMVWEAEQVEGQIYNHVPGNTNLYAPS